MTDYDVIIVGGGAAAFGAALYCRRFDLKTLMLAEKLGGTVMLTSEIENYPGFEKLSGMELVDNLKNHVKKYDVEIIEKKAVSVSGNGPFSVSVKEAEYTAKSIIFATGSEWRKLGVPGEEEFTGKGVHFCALCDGFFYKDKTIAIIGGSDSAAKEALLLTEYAKKVYIIYRKENIRAEPIIKKRVAENKKIEIISNTNVLEIKGKDKVKGVVLDNAYNGSTEFELDGVFVAIGHIPLSGLAKELGVELNKKGELVIDRDGNTSMKGVFAAGDVVNTRFKQIITGVAEGVVAANNAYEYVSSLEK